MKIIGISGKMGTGKTTLADALIERLGSHKWLRRSFADALKEEVAESFNVPIKWCYTRSGKSMPVEFGPAFARAAKIFGYGLPGGTMNVRQLLQWWGTKVRRKQDPHYWTDRMLAWVYAQNEAGAGGAIIDDVRFPDELRLVRSLGGLVYRIEPYPGWSYDHSTHVSETALDGYTAWDSVFCPGYGEIDVVADEIADSILV